MGKDGTYHHPSPNSAISEEETAITQHLPSAKSSEGVEVKIYIISRPSVKSANRNRLKVSIQTSSFTIPYKVEKTQVKIANSLKLSEKVEEYHKVNKNDRLTSTVLSEML